MFTRRHSAIAMGLLGLLSLAVTARAQTPAPTVNLPYTTPDGIGGSWWVYNDGGIRQQVPPAIYATGAQLLLDNANFSTSTNQGVLASKTGELILENAQMNGLDVVRRIFFDQQESYVRYVEVLHNVSDKDRTVNVMLQTVFNWGIQGQVLADPKHKEQNIAWAAMTQFSKGVLEIYGGPRGKVTPTITYQNNNVVQVNYSMTIPAGKEVALVHFHMFTTNVDAGQTFLAQMNPGKLLHNLPGPLRREIVNFSVGGEMLADVDILRGDVFDAVELRGGDQLRGTLNETDYKLNSFYGTIDLPPNHVVGILNVGAGRPRQLIVTDDGEFFGGRLEKPTIDITLTSGQSVSIPLDQVSRVGYRKRLGEPDEWTYDKPLVVMRTGDRVDVQLPPQPIPVATRYGLLSLDPASLAAISFQPDEGGVNEIELTDGSKFAGLVAADTLSMQLSGMGGGQVVQFPVSAMRQMQLVPHPADPDSDVPQLSLLNQDLLCGSLVGEMKLQTAFDSIDVHCPQIRHMAPSGDETRITLWDGSVITGQVAEPAVSCKLLSGAELNVPVSLLREYSQPHPMPSADVVKQIQATAADLNADDWRERDRAQTALVSMGPAVIGVLRDLRSSAPPEAQQRIDAVLKQIDAAAKPSGPGVR